MKYLSVFVLVAGMVLGGSLLVKAQELTESVLVGNRNCPVSGQKMGDAGMVPSTYEYNKKVYNLCCSGCAAQFKVDPEKYSKIADEQVMRDKEQVKDASNANKM